MRLPADHHQIVVAARSHGGGARRSLPRRECGNPRRGNEGARCHTDRPARLTLTGVRDARPGRSAPGFGKLADAFEHVWLAIETGQDPFHRVLRLLAAERRYLDTERLLVGRAQGGIVEGLAQRLAYRRHYLWPHAGRIAIGE